MLIQSQKMYHRKALKLCKHHRKVESLLVEVLRDIERSNTYKAVGRPSVFQYAVKDLDLSGAVAYSFISVARGSTSELLKAIRDQRLSIYKASRIVGTLKCKGAEGLVEFAIKNSCKKTQAEVARI